ncbi:hypothetical protein PAEVO_51270 [Paenibacillus sp. GM2FR]|nr:hypothetical protein PAEVO_51270 [Paenibacillus sp. GM2FR]
MEASSLFVLFVTGCDTQATGDIAFPIAALAWRGRVGCCIFKNPWYDVFKES